MKKLDIPDQVATLTIPELLHQQAALRPDALHAIFPDCALTFGDLHRQASQWAKAYHALGVGPGDHVATLMPNCASWLPAYYGALYVGAVVVALNARYKRHELSYTLAHSNARVLVTTDLIAEHVDFAELLNDVLPDLAGQKPGELALKAAPELRAIVLCDGPSKDGMFDEATFLALGNGADEAAIATASASRTVADTAAIIYTSGTTSNPKGCELTHGGIQNSWSTYALVVNLQPEQTVWMPMPFFHTGGIGPMTTMLSRGAAFISQPHYEPEAVVDLIERHKADHLYPGFPQLAFGVIEHPRFDRERFGHVRSLLNVGPPAMQQRIQNLLPEGAVLLNLFGMTEGSGIVSFTPADAPFAVRAVTSGMPPPHSDVRIVDPETGLICADGSAGEIQFRGGGAFKAYYRDPEATAATIVDGGWVRTGDRGMINEDGYLIYMGRLKDMLKVGGENVAAAEIEAFLQGLPDVRLAQVIGMPDDRLGEVPIAFIEMIGDARTDEATVIAACQGQLAKWKVPRAVRFVTEWPMSATKVQKYKLAELVGTRPTSG